MGIKTNLIYGGLQLCSQFLYEEEDLQEEVRYYNHSSLVKAGYSATMTISTLEFPAGVTFPFFGSTLSAR